MEKLYHCIDAAMQQANITFVGSYRHDRQKPKCEEDAVYCPKRARLADPGLPATNCH